MRRFCVLILFLLVGSTLPIINAETIGSNDEDFDGVLDENDLCPDSEFDISLINENNTYDLSTEAGTNGQLPNGLTANWATRLPNNEDFFATAYEMDMSTGLSTDNSFFLAYDFDQYNDAPENSSYEYRIYSVDANSDDPNAGHSFNVVTSVESAGQFLYFASQYAADYNPQVPGLEVLVTGMMYYDMDSDGTAETALNGIRAITVTGTGAGYALDIAVTGAGPSQAISAMGDIMYWYQNDDGTSTLKSVLGGGDHGDFNVAIQKNNRMVGTDSTLTFMSDVGLETFITHSQFGILHAGTNTDVQGYALGFTNDLNWLIIGQSADLQHGGGLGGFTLVGIGADNAGAILSVDTTGQGVFGTFGTVLNSPTGNTYIYYNSINLFNGEMDVFAYQIAGTDTDANGEDDGTSTAQDFESNPTVTIDPALTNFGAYSGVIGVYREGINTAGETVFQLVITNPDLGINLALWSDQNDLLAALSISNLAVVLGLPSSPTPNYDAGFFTKYVHDLGLGSGKIITTYIDSNGNMNPGLIDLVAILQGEYNVDVDGCTPSQRELFDSDGDGVVDNEDAFPNDANETADSDGDGVGDNADAFPNDSNETVDFDGDGIGDNSDQDTDNDGILNIHDAFPNDPNEWEDTDGDGIGDNSDKDDDNDGVVDNADTFPNDATETTDSDGDGVGDNADAFPNDATETTDSDGDGVGDNADAFPNDPDETTDSLPAPGVGIILAGVAIALFASRKQQNHHE